MSARSGLLFLLLAFASCRSPERSWERPAPISPPAADLLPDPVRASPPEARGEIVVAGQRYSTSAPVVSWDEAPFYDAHLARPRFSSEGESGLRYQPHRSVRDAGLAARIGETDHDLEELRQLVDLFVLHYDACGISRECFRVLQDQRGLSVHFLLDLDGTIYQTLDLAAQAWHARQANPRSIGIEIAQVGAYPPGERAVLDRWYVARGGRLQIQIPSAFGDAGLRTPGFEGAPARPGLQRGSVQGRPLVQYDFTPQQYDSLAALTRSLVELFPRIAPDAPRDANGRVESKVLSAAELDAFHGILGHYHISETKVDPGPAFQWEAFLARVNSPLSLQSP